MESAFSKKKVPVLVLATTAAQTAAVFAAIAAGTCHMPHPATA